LIAETVAEIEVGANTRQRISVIATSIKVGRPTAGSPTAIAPEAQSTPRTQVTHPR
jgi:hypothetical protein